MKKIFGFMLMPMLACGLALAQQSATPGDTDHVKTKTMKGCVEQRDGNYYLVNKKGHDVELMGNDLSAHVGHKVEVTGTMQPMSDQMTPGTTKADKDRATSEDPDKTTHDNSATSHHEKKEMDKHNMMMSVSSVEMKSETCDMK
jgi:hypothetical protein